MKSIGVTLQRTYLTKNYKKKHCAHPAKLSNILAGGNNLVVSLMMKGYYTRR